ncbi:NAD(P)/FAD-dependent oxidoreductase [uncultured Corynebacterium sp.]|uniref:NAD(P)/FAD-dependent oxidoreductase n=1 Tax=uncultured Corynebacterium sp. TaxID=159447 RepID=UPI0025F8F4E4|nr:NAD(P)/FAD-dependent oxidoreductase [uncultured Corynebacterium sp.]
METFDCVIIGAGPAGLQAAQILGRARRKVVVIDGGEPRNAPAAAMHGVLGHDGADPAEFLARGRKELEKYNITVVRDEVRNVTKSLTVVFSQDKVKARTLIVATGVTDELPEVPGLSQGWGDTVLHCPYCHAYEHAGQRLGVLGTGEDSTPLALMMHQWSDDVTYFAAGARIHPQDREVMEGRGMTIVDEEVLAFQNGQVLLGGADPVEVDALFVSPTFRPQDSFLDNLHLDRVDLPHGLGNVLAVDAAGQTSDPRIWAVGNVTNPSATVPVAIGAGATAGGLANAYLNSQDWLAFSATLA